MPTGSVWGGKASGPMPNGYGKKGDQTFGIELGDSKGGGGCMEVAAPVVVAIGIVGLVCKIARKG